ncbi:Mdm2-binding protein [Holothuria leucospilota]|uniref:Mdm2-binding protein n=1 Tax=Holothuria leucospilota TaxID=206669 RepID=A0A9Q1BDH1_HOLLE|nr:Mdm2-binding protein [Holothuria leucospilota]
MQLFPDPSIDTQELLQKFYRKGTSYLFANVTPSSLQSDWYPVTCTGTDVVSSGREEPAAISSLNLQPSGLQEQIAACLHSLGDKLPLEGFQLDVIWLIPNVSTVKMGENLHLLGALKRLHSWHNAQFTLIQSSENAERIDWLSILEARHIIWSKKNWGGPLDDIIWRGNLKLQEGKNNASVSLPGFQLSLRRPEETVDVSVSRNGDRKTLGIDQVKEKLVLSNSIEVVDIVNLDDVPRCLLLSDKMQLAVPASDILPRSYHFLNWITADRANEKIAIVIEMPYTTHHLAVPDCESSGLGTAAWKEQLAKNPSDFSVPSCDREGTRQGSEYLLLYRNPAGNCCAQSFVSVTELNGAAQAQVARIGSLGMLKNIGQHDEDCNALQGVPVMSETTFQRFLDSVAQLQLDGLKKLAEERLKEDPNSVLSLQEVRELFAAIKRDCMRAVNWLDLATSLLDQDGCHYLASAIVSSELDSDPAKIPERLALYNREAVKEKMRRQKSSDMQLAGMAVPPPVNDTITLHLNASEFLKHFHPNGLPVGQDFSPIGIATRSHSHASTPSKHSSRPHLSEIELKKLEFKDSLKYQLPGIDYCIDQSTINNDAKMSRLLLRLVPLETATTCSHNSATSVIKLRRKSLESSPLKKLVPTPRKGRSKYSGKSPRTLKRSRRSETGTTPKKKLKVSPSSASGISQNTTAAGSSQTPRQSSKPHNSSAEQFLSPRKSFRLTSPCKTQIRSKSESFVSPRKSQRHVSPTKLSDGEIPSNLLTPRRSKRLETPQKSETDSLKKQMAKNSNSQNKKIAVRKSPRKSSHGTPRKSKGSPSKATPSKQRAMSAPSAEGAKQRGRLVSRSERHKRKLMEIVTKLLAERGIDKSHPSFKKCCERLYTISKGYVQDLKTSRGLYKEMLHIVSLNVDVVIKFELRSNSKSAS